jgi:hypothetical protein
MDNFPVAVFRCNHTDQSQGTYHNYFPAQSGYAGPPTGISAWSAVFTEQDSGSGAVSGVGMPWTTRNFDNSQTVRMRPFLPCVRYGNTGDVPGAANAYWGLDQIRQQYPEWQVWLCAVLAGGSGNLGNKGRVRDLHTAFGLTELICEPSGADPITRVVWGGYNNTGFWFPGNQVLSF